jgi:TfoX/Sxy family transcriptional regulator of competence genes
MATSQDTIDFILDQARNAGSLTYRKMFGEYALYLNGKVIAFVCDDELFIKPTEAGNAYIGDPDMKPAYPGSKLYFRISGDRIEDGEWLAELFRITAAALPLQKPKNPRKQKSAPQPDPEPKRNEPFTRD